MDSRRSQREKELRIKLIIIAAVIAALIVVLIVVINKINKPASSAAANVTKEVSAGNESSKSDRSVQRTEAALAADSLQAAAVHEAVVEEAVVEAAAEAAVQTPSPQPPAGVSPCERDDGTGGAGVKEMPEEMTSSSAETGWHFNDWGLWYSTSPGLCYYNGWKEIDGLTYHFDGYGHADRGWKLIGGQSCYFDDNGAYDPTADNSRLLAFTFDDGPSQGMDQILDLCSQTGARVTFYMIGKQLENGGGVLPFITKYRCELGNHSNSHSNMDTKAPEECAADFAQCNELIAANSGGFRANTIRFPYGNITDANLAAAGYPSIYWDVDTFDWMSETTTQNVIDVVLDTISEGNIILMHDRYNVSVEACQYLFPYLISQGYQLVTISELAAAKGIDLQPGVTYYNFRG